MTEYLKAFVPLVLAVAVVLVDKLLVGDDIPDAVWLALFGTTPVVWAVPNAEKKPVRRHRKAAGTTLRKDPS